MKKKILYRSSLFCLEHDSGKRVFLFTKRMRKYSKKYTNTMQNIQQNKFQGKIMVMQNIQQQGLESHAVEVCRRDDPKNMSETSSKKETI